MFKYHSIISKNYRDVGIHDVVTLNINKIQDYIFDLIWRKDTKRDKSGDLVSYSISPVCPLHPLGKD